MQESEEKTVGPMRPAIVPNSWTSDPTDAFLSTYEVAFTGPDHHNRSVTSSPAGDAHTSPTAFSLVAE